jgi:putative oxidoreductase
VLAKNGFWGTLHEGRTDVSMLLGLIFLLLVGSGALSIDVKPSAKREQKNSAFALEA